MKNKCLKKALLVATCILFTNSIHAASTVNWGYYQHGESPVILPEQWGDYFPDCNGFSQSPINISNSINSTLSELDIEYEDTPLRVINNGHTIQVDYAPGSSVYLDYDDHRVLQFHFHTPSENVVDGVSYPMEMHIVHANTAGALTVIAVFIELGEANETFEAIINNAPLHKGEYISSSEINVDALLPKKIKHYFNFTGSLTTPPCSEGVNWIVLEKPITFSAQQIKMFKDIVHINNRPLQNINDRTIFYNTK